MKQKYLLSVLIIFAFSLTPYALRLSTAQVPQGFNYQAIARDVSGDALINANLEVYIGILKDTVPDDYLWEEKHLVKTNAFGLFSIVIGDTLAEKTGGSATGFSDINWLSDPLFIRTKVYHNSIMHDMGAVKLQSVPYAFKAGDLAGSVEKLVVSGKSTSLTDPLFEVRNNNDQPVFAVYNEGVRVYVSNGDPGKGAKGGFAIGGFDMGKGGDEYLRVTRDSTRVYINDLPGGKGAKGGFAIGGFSSAKTNYDFFKVDESKLKGGKVDYLNLTSLNTFIGELAGIKTVPAGESGSFNSFIGYKSGFNNTSGTGNVFLGYQSGINNKEGVYNVFIGNEAGYSNIGIGSFTGDYNVFIGYASGYYNTDGVSNVFVGKQAGWRNTKGRYNTFLGISTGAQNQEGNFNTYLGGQAAEFKTRGNNNVFVGVGAGAENYKGSGNVFIGYRAGSSETDSALLYIENSNSLTPLIGGDFDADMVAINGKPNPASATFQVNGNTRLGYNGTSIGAVIRAAVWADLPSISANTSVLQTFSLPNSNASATVMISPSGTLEDGLIISYARVSTNGTVEVKFRNTSTASIDILPMNWYITVIQ